MVVRRVWLVVATAFASLVAVCASAAAAPQPTGPAPGDTAWVYPLVGGSVLALLLGGALVLVLLRGRRR
jgi:hypothetical protein